MTLRVLIVDDSVGFRSAARDLLVDDGYDVVAVAADGAAGIAAAAAHRPDLVVLDVALPDLDGFEVAERLREVSPDAQVVLVSSRDWSRLDARIAACGAHAFLPKDLLDGATLTQLTGRGP